MGALPGFLLLAAWEMARLAQGRRSKLPRPAPQVPAGLALPTKRSSPGLTGRGCLGNLRQRGGRVGEVAGQWLLHRYLPGEAAAGVAHAQHVHASGQPSYGQRKLARARWPLLLHHPAQHVE